MACQLSRPMHGDQIVARLHAQHRRNHTKVFFTAVNLFDEFRLPNFRDPEFGDIVEELHAAVGHPTDLYFRANSPSVG